MIDIRRKPEGIVFKVFVQPKASKNSIAGEHDRALKIRLTAPPVGGAANKMAVKFLAKQLNRAKSDLEIISGHTSRTKFILIRYNHTNPPEQQEKELTAAIQNMIASK